MAEPGSLGGVSQTEIQQMAEAIGSPPSEAGASLSTRFVRQVSSLVAARSAVGESGEFSVFIRSESLISDLAKVAYSEFPLLMNGQDTVSDRAWISTASLNATYNLTLAWTDQASLYTAVRATGLGHLPALVVDWRPARPLGHFYPDGLGSPDLADRVIFEDIPISEDEMKEAMDNFYNRSLRSPLLIAEGHADRVWSDAAKGIPRDRPEEKIQGRLTDALKSRFARHDVRAEPVTADGRADVIVYRRTLSLQNLPAVQTQWVLELKALCDMTSNGTATGSSHIPEAIKSGLEQVVAYKGQLSALRGAVCCFDMQKKDHGDNAIFNHIAASAQQLGIDLWRWFLFRSTADSRQAKSLVTVTK